MWFKIRSFIKFLIKSSNEHGIHSPFVYALTTKCFYKKTSPDKIKLYNSFRNKLFKNPNEIRVIDYGSGSKIFKNNVRKVAAIAKIAGISKKRAGLLMRFVEYYPLKKVLEIGTSLGLGTAALQIGNPKISIDTLEGCENTASIAEKSFENFGFNKINIHVNTFEKSLPVVLQEKKYDLIFFDGNHQKEATLAYYKTCLSSIHNDTVFIFDDIHWSSEMDQAWDIIRKKPEVKVSIDTYQWGFVFFRKEQKKQHFIIRV